jgi:ribonuclease HI
MEKVICYTKGEARGNPGPAGIGVYIVDKAGVVQKEVSQTIGNSTADFAEYYAVMTCLQTLQTLYGEQSTTMQFELRLENEVVQQQLNNELPITHPGLVPMFIEIHNMRVTSFPNLSCTRIKETENTHATRLVHEALGDQK